MSARPFNRLSPADAELFAPLAEECGEVVQVVGKILRHGVESHHPRDRKKRTNRTLLEKELGDVRAAMILLCEAGVVNKQRVHGYADLKRKKVQLYLHHQPEEST